MADSALVLFDPGHGFDVNLHLDSDMSFVCIGHCQGCKCPGMVGAIRWKKIVNISGPLRYFKRFIFFL